MVVIGEPVELVKVSTVRAKSWLPVLGTVILRLTVKPGERAAGGNAGFARRRPCCRSRRAGLEQRAADISRPSPSKALFCR